MAEVSTKGHNHDWRSLAGLASCLAIASSAFFFNSVNNLSKQKQTAVTANPQRKEIHAPTRIIIAIAYYQLKSLSQQLIQSEKWTSIGWACHKGIAHEDSEPLLNFVNNFNPKVSDEYWWTEVFGWTRETPHWEKRDEAARSMTSSMDVKFQPANKSVKHGLQARCDRSKYARAYAKKGKVPEELTDPESTVRQMHFWECPIIVFVEANT